MTDRDGDVLMRSDGNEPQISQISQPTDEPEEIEGRGRMTERAENGRRAPQRKIKDPKSEIATSDLDTSWRVLLWLIDHDFAVTPHKTIAKDLHVSRSSVTRAISALVAHRILEPNADGSLEPGLILAQAYARRLRYWGERHRRMQMTLRTMGAELAILVSDGDAAGAGKP